MRKRRFTEEQIIAILQEGAAGTQTSELVRRHGISRETFDTWRRKYGGLKIEEVKRLRAREDENRRRKRVVADRALNIQVLKDLLGKGSMNTMAEAGERHYTRGFTRAMEVPRVSTLRRTGRS